MAVVQDITNLILLADGYLLSLQEDRLAEQVKGCSGCSSSAIMQQVIMLKEQLLYQVEIEDMGERTDSLYTCLLQAIENYSGASITVDPNASIPNTVIDVTVVGNDSPYDITIQWSDLLNTGDAGRTRYENPLWAGWLPILWVDSTTKLYYNVDGHIDDIILLPSGGFMLNPNGNVPVLYDGQVISAMGFSPFTAPPLPAFQGLVLLGNNSSYDIVYNDNFAGNVTLPTGQQYIKDPIVNGQTFVTNFSRTVSGVARSITYQRYNENGTPDGAPVVIAAANYPTPAVLTVSGMSITKTHRFTVADT